MFSKLLLVALVAVGANANLLTNKLKAKAVACDDPSGECGEGKDCHPKYVETPDPAHPPVLLCFIPPPF